jgi:acyl-CoA dehydrogenase
MLDGLTHEQQMLQESTRRFVDEEMLPHEDIVDREGHVPIELGRQIESRSKEVGLFAANLPENVGGGGLDYTSMAVIEREFGRTSHALHAWVARPTELLLATEGGQKEHYLDACVTGAKRELFALSEPEAGSDIMSMKTNAKRDGNDWILNGSKHFISGPLMPDFAIVFAITGHDETPRGPRPRITAFLVDVGMPGFDIQVGYNCVSYRGYLNFKLDFDNVRLSPDHILGEKAAALNCPANGLAWDVSGLGPPVVARPNVCLRWQKAGPQNANNLVRLLASFRPLDLSLPIWR